MASCITPIPIPAMPNPAAIYSTNNIGLLLTKPEERVNNGIKNKDSIITVFTTIVVLALRLLFFVLKWTFTRLLNVLAKSGFMSRENLGLASILILFG